MYEVGTQRDGACQVLKDGAVVFWVSDESGMSLEWASKVVGLLNAYGDDEVA